MGVISKQIIKATDDSQSRPNKELIAKIINYLQMYPDSHQEAVDTIRQRFSDNNAKVQMFACFLVDKLMKKLDDSFIAQVGSKDFLNCLVLILSNEESVGTVK
jgi:hypothetical protein